MVNQDGELGILGCNSYVHLFSKHGEFKRTIKSHIDSPEFLVPIRDKWYVFNKEGNGQPTKSNDNGEIVGKNQETCAEMLIKMCLL